jgi:hypothetical protein
MPPVQRRSTCGAILFTVVLSSAVAQAQPGATLSVDAVGDDVRKLLRQIDQMAADGQIDEAVDRLTRLMDQRGNLLIGTAEAAKSTDAAYERYVPLREVCQARLAAWADSQPGALALYRRRVDPLAERWFREAVEQHDEALLARVAEQMFASSYGDNALLRLGEIHLERGQYAAARRAWERISPALRAGPVLRADQVLHAGVQGWPLWMVLHGDNWAESLSAASASAKVSLASPAYPDTDVNLADVLARLVVASILEGSLERAEIELAVVRRLHPQATGNIAGRSGNYADVLTGLLEDARSWTPAAQSPDWPTYGGSQQRGGLAPGGVSPTAAPLWRKALPEVLPKAPERPELLPVGIEWPRRDKQPSPACFPIVVAGKVYYCDATRIWGFDLHSGAAVEESDPLLKFDVPPGESPAHMAYTLGSNGRRLLARIGPPPGAMPSPTRLLRELSCLVGVDLDTQKLLFDPIHAGGPEWDFEGPPVADEARLYVLLRKTEGEGPSVSLHVACHELSSGKQLWRRLLCRNTGGEWFAGLPPALLTLQDDTLYACTNLGCVAAIAADDGRVRWAFEYPRQKSLGGPGVVRPSTPNPCLVHQGIVYAAPLDSFAAQRDSRELLALDAATGELIWSAELHSDGENHLLGVAHGCLIVGGDSLRWFDLARRGPDRLVAQFPLQEFPEPLLARPGPRGFGRGVLAGGLVYWPTRERIYVFQQRLDRSAGGPEVMPAGEIDLADRNLESGNLVISDGVLLIASPKHLQALK